MNIQSYIRRLMTDHSPVNPVAIMAAVLTVGALGTGYAVTCSYPSSQNYQLHNGFPDGCCTGPGYCWRLEYDPPVPGCAESPSASGRCNQNVNVITCGYRNYCEDPCEASALCPGPNRGQCNTAKIVIQRLPYYAYGVTYTAGAPCDSATAPNFFWYIAPTSGNCNPGSEPQHPCDGQSG